MANTTTTSSQIPSYIQDPTKRALGDIESYLKSPDNYVYGSKPGEKLFTPLSQGQQKAIGNVNWLADQDLASLFGINKAGSMLEDASGKLTDETGWLGSIDSYMNPYLQRVLDPQLKQISDSLQAGRRDLGANAAMSGAFGDARHGIVEGELYDDAARQATDVTGKAYAGAWDNAMEMRGADRSARAGAASGIASLGQQNFQNFMDVNDALFNAGEVERDTEKERNDTMRAFQEALKEKKYTDAMKLLGAIQGSPYTTSSTSTQKSNDGIWGLLGALGGAFL